MKEKTVNILLILFAVLIIIVAFVKYILPRMENNDEVALNINQITLMDVKDTSIKFKELNDVQKNYFVYLFSLNDCYSCIMKGLADTKGLEKKGKKIIIIVIHNSYKEMKSWAKTNSFHENIYFLDKEQFYSSIKAPYLPVIITIKNNKVSNYKFITL